MRLQPSGLERTRFTWLQEPDVRRGVLAIVLLTLLAYSPAIFNGGFIWDDDQYVTRNPLLGMGWEGLKQIWQPRNTPQFYPLTFTSFWLEHRWWGVREDGSPNPFGYHLTNVLLHAVSALLVWRLFARLQVRGAWLVAAIFALHPLHVESVAWIAERKNVLSGFFYLTAAWCYLRFDDPPSEPAAGESRRWRWYAAALVLFVAALLSKTITCSLPAALILVMVYQRKRLNASRLLPLAPFFVVGVALAMITAELERSFVGPLDFAVDAPRTFAENIVIAGRSLLFYPFKLLVPYPLIFNYPRWEIEAGAVLSYWPVAVWVGVAAACIAAFRKGRRGPFVAVSFYAGTVFPAVGFFYIYPHRYSFVADHFSYLANLGIIALMVAGLRAVFKDGQAFRFAAGVWLALCLVLTFQQSRIYRDEPTVWRDTLAKNPGSWMAHNNLGADALDEANAFLRAREINPAGAAFARVREHAEAVVRLKPDHYNAHFNLADALRFERRYAEAAAHLETAVDILRDGFASSPEKLQSFPLTDYLNELGELRELQGDLAGAEAAYRQSLDHDPRSPFANWNLGRVLMNAGRGSEASLHFARVIRELPAAVVERGGGSPNQQLLLLFRQASKAAPSSFNETQANRYHAGLALARLWTLAPVPAYQHPLRALEIVEGLVAETEQPAPELLELLAALQGKSP